MRISDSFGIDPEALSPQVMPTQDLHSSDPKGFQPGSVLDPYSDELLSTTSVRIDRTNKLGNLLGYSLITETDWDTYIETYDLDDNLIDSTYTDTNGYTQTSTWESVLDADGAVVGQRHSSVSSDGSFNHNRVETYDSEGNLLSSTYKSSDGDWETIKRIAPPDLPIGPVPLSHAFEISGAWADGSAYQRNELFNIQGNLVRSESQFADGSSELYAIAPLFAEDGSILGYEGTTTWIDQNGEVTSSVWVDHFDIDFNPIFYPEEYPAYDFWLSNARGANNDSDDAIATQIDPEFLYDSKSQEFFSTPANPLFKGLINDDPTKQGFVPRIITSDDKDVKLNSFEHREITHATLLGNADLTARGNKLSNVLVGNDGDNTIAGGRSKDLVIGGDGHDFFTFRHQRRSLDTITDFNPDEDKLVLKGKSFRDLFTPSGLEKGVLGTFLLFEEESSQLLFAPQGEGFGSRPIKLAVLYGLAASELSSDLFVLG